MYPNLVLEYSYNFSNLAKEIYVVSELRTPVIVSVSILNAANLRLHRGQSWQSRYSDPQVIGEEPILQLPPIFVQDFIAEPTLSTVKALNDSLWNAFGLRECTYMDSAGNFSEESNLQLAE